MILLIATAAFCLNNGYAIDGGACNGTVFLPNSPIGGVYDTSAVLGDTVYQYYINRIDTTISYFQGPIFLIVYLVAYVLEIMKCKC